MIVTCANCDTDVYKVVVDIYAGKLIMASDFDGINGYKSPRAGDEIICPSCGDADGMVSAIKRLPIPSAIVVDRMEED